jgi:hypothetical protein
VINFMGNLAKLLDVMTHNKTHKGIEINFYTVGNHLVLVSWNTSLINNWFTALITDYFAQLAVKYNQSTTLPIQARPRMKSFSTQDARVFNLLFYFSTYL